MKVFVEEIGRGSFGRAEAKGQIEKYKKRRGRMIRRQHCEPDSQESLIKSILECEECIANLESIHAQQSKLRDSTLFDANRIGMH